MTDAELVKRIQSLEIQLKRLRQPEQPLPNLLWTTWRAPYALTDDNQTLWMATIVEAAAFTYWKQSVAVNTTNNGSNYWTLSLRKWSDNIQIASLNTSALTAGTPALLTYSGSEISLTTSMIGVYIRAEKTGTPGPFYGGNPVIHLTGV